MKMSERGSSIVEVMVALMVLGTAVLPVTGLLRTGYRFQGQARLDVEMATLAEAKIEELLAISGTSLPDTVALTPGGSLVSDVADHWDAVVHEDRSFTRRWRVESGPAGVRDITIRVIPHRPAGSRAIEMSTQVNHD